jgi:NADPH:quinone reductase-like Zn-dependent oxidoreductase
MPLLPKETEVIEDAPVPRNLFARKNRDSTLKEAIMLHGDAADSRNDERPFVGWLGKTSANPSPTPTAESNDSSTNAAIKKIPSLTLFQDKRQMKVVIHQFGENPKDVCVIEQENMPEPETADHVIIKVQAATVTLRDCLFRRGHCFDFVSPTTLPMTPGHDAVGKIVAVGANVKEFKEGERVAALIRTGGNARYANVLSSHLVRVPAIVDAAEAACMVSVHTAAYQSMKLITSQGPTFSLTGKKILIIGGMEGVGQALVQMCNKARAEVYATCPERRHVYMKNVLGARPLPEDSKVWLPQVQGKMDVVFDGLCEDGLDAACKALVKNGEVVCFGHAAMIKEEMGVFGAPLSAYLNKWKSHLTRAKTIDIWDSFKEDQDQYKVWISNSYKSQLCS